MGKRKFWINLSPVYVRSMFLKFGFSQTQLGSITSRCSGNEPALLPRKGEEQRPDSRERRKSSLRLNVLIDKVLDYKCVSSPFHFLKKFVFINRFIVQDLVNL